MSGSNKIYNVLCSCICVFGVAIFLWALISDAGKYYGNLNARFMVLSPEDLEESFAHYLNLSSETEQKWYWNKPENFTYKSIDIHNGDKACTISLSSMTCLHEKEIKLFTRSFLKEYIVSGEGDGSKKIMPEQLDEIYDFIISAGNGIAPRPRHHRYYSESPCDSSISNFCLGGPTLFIWGLSIFVAGIAMKFFSVLAAFKVSRSKKY